MKVIFLCLFLTVLFTNLGYPQDVEVAKFPNRPITLIIPLPPATVADLAMRLLTKEAEKYLGQPIVVVNKPGGGGSVGVAAIASAKPDGYTIGVATHSALYMIPLLEKVPYHPVKDLKPIIQFSAFNLGVIVKGESPFKRFNDLIAFARQNPKKLTYGTVGLNSMQNIIMEYIARHEKVEFTHIPFRGSPEVQTALLGGHVQVSVGEANYSFLESSQQILLLLFNEERSVEFPQTPILKDLGYSIRCPTPLIIAAPKDIPESVATKIEDALTHMMKVPAFIKGMKEDIRQPIVYRNSQELRAYVASNYEYFANFIKEIRPAK